MKPAPQNVGTKRKQVFLESFLSKKKQSTGNAAIGKVCISSKVSTSPDPVASGEKRERADIELIVEADCKNNSSKASTIHPKDIYNFVHCAGNLSDAEKYDLLSSVWKPEKSYEFPHILVNNKKRKFQQQWLNNFPWLAYSAAANGGFCINCVLFGGESTHNSCKLQRLKSSPLLPSNSTVQKLNDHVKTSKVHETATIRATEFKRVMENKQLGIDLQINHARKQLIEKNRMRLRPIVDAIITCGRQNLALRGHRDDAHYYIHDDKTNSGNFIEILKYGARCGDMVELLFKDCPSNQTYRSKTFQNELIEICGEYITESLVDEIKKAKFFSVLADEATDCSNVGY